MLSLSVKMLAKVYFAVLNQSLETPVMMIYRNR